MKLGLIGTFAATSDKGEDVKIPPNGGRLLALLALHRHGLTRGCTAGVLWPEKNEDRASANLRSTLWRLKSTRSIAIIDREPAVLCLAPGVQVDLDNRSASGFAIDQLLSDLLDGWADAWVEPFRIRWRQTRLHAIDRRCSTLFEQQRYRDVVDLAQIVLEAEPLRESVLRLLVQAEMQLNQPDSATQVIDLYKDRLSRELGAEASPQMTELETMVAEQVRRSA